MKKIVLIAFTMLYASSAQSASCCGGGSSSSAIITDDNQQELTLGYSYRNDIGQTDSDGLSSLHDDSIKDQQFLYTLQFSKIIFDRFQSSIKLGVTTKDLDKQNRAEEKSGLQDIELQAAYEFLPEYSYSPVKPRGFGYLKASIPMSRSLYDSQSNVFADVRGTGLFALSPGLLFVKKLSNVSLKSGGEYQYYFGKQYSEFKLNDYYRFVIPFGASYALGRYPVILSATSTWNYQSSRSLEGNIQSRSPSESFWDLNLSSTYRISDQASLTLAYSDSSLLGKSLNSPLYRIIGLSYSYGWPL